MSFMNDILWNKLVHEFVWGQSSKVIDLQKSKVKRKKYDYILFIDYLKINLQKKENYSSSESKTFLSVSQRLKTFFFFILIL